MHKMSSQGRTEWLWLLSNLCDWWWLHNADILGMILMSSADVFICHTD